MCYQCYGATFLNEGVTVLADVDDIRDLDPCPICFEEYVADLQDYVALAPPYQCAKITAEFDMSPSHGEFAMRIKACGHVVSERCLKAHINGNEKRNGKCPMCRTPLFPYNSGDYVDGSDTEDDTASEQGDSSDEETDDEEEEDDLSGSESDESQSEDDDGNESETNGECAQEDGAAREDRTEESSDEDDEAFEDRIIRPAGMRDEHWAWIIEHYLLIQSRMQTHDKSLRILRSSNRP